MFYLLNTQNPENDYSTGKRIITAHFECDTVSDLPALVQSTYIARIGSTAHIIDTNALYAVQSNGTWFVQETGTDVYTKSQIDTMLLQKADISAVYTKTQTDTLLSVKANSADVYTKSEVDSQCGAIVGLSGKNMCPYNNLTTQGGSTVLSDMPINLPSGTYILSFTQTATTGSNSFRFLYNGNSIVNFTINNDSTPTKTREFTLASPANQIRLYSSVANDYSLMMIRKAEIVDDSFVDYAPTNRELYEMIQALQ